MSAATRSSSSPAPTSDLFRIRVLRRPNSGALRARSDVYGGSWEGFTFEWIGEESTFAMKSQANGVYVAVDKNYTGALQNLLLSSTASAATSTPLRDVVERPQPWAIWATAQCLVR
ncbi:hypothetical protein [Streptomyces albogriseolus]|uniref:hypothetical protein n=1 Tax=Streptomyces albogriseolus TaxID=1887 RepID=UPI00225B80F6|nr:hypothetical protein [Streptomyces viridodiastaticus]MCX4564801.1 hypothetical protein [Streptomyces viridodiastaticus]